VNEPKSIAEVAVILKDIDEQQAKIRDLKIGQTTFENFLNLLWKAGSFADSTKRFRDFLKAIQAEDEALRRFVQFKQSGFYDLTSWLDTADN